MGSPLAFAPAVWAFIGAGLLFGAMVIVRWVFVLVHDVKELAEDAQSASRRLEHARSSAATEVAGARRRLDAIRSGGGRGRKRLRASQGPDNRPWV